MEYPTDLTFDFSFGSFELIYDSIHQSFNKQWYKGQPPLIEPFSFPTGGIGLRTYVSECVSIYAPASWHYAGTLVQWIPTDQISSNTGIGFLGLPIRETKIPLNRMKLHVLEKVANGFSFGFEPAPWLFEFHFRLWRWNGIEREDVIDELNDVQADIENIQQTLDEIKTQTNKIP